MSTAPYQFRVGDIDALVIADESVLMTETRFNGIFTREEDQGIREAFTKLTSPLFGRNILFLRTPTQRILIDTGEGYHANGHFLERLQAAGIEPETIDLIIITHFHFDHVGGMRDQEGSIIFPHARVVVPRQEWEHWMRDDILATMRDNRGEILKATFEYYRQAGRLEIVESDHEVAPGIQMVPMPGHTPGHVGVSITSGEETLLHIADTAHFPLQSQFPRCVVRFDLDPEQTVTTRRAVFEDAAESHVLTLAYHFPFPGLGHINREDNAFLWQPLKSSEAP